MGTQDSQNAQKATTRGFLFGAPFGRENQRAFEKALEDRFEEKEKAVEYIDKIVDRQISKATGLLTVNAVLFTAFSISHEDGNVSLVIAAFLVLVSSLALMSVMYVRWSSDVTQYKTPESDFLRACHIVYRRSHILSFALLSSGLALLIAILHVLSWWTSGPGG